jgi:hypothetical protein
VKSFYLMDQGAGAIIRFFNLNLFSEGGMPEW